MDKHERETDRHWRRRTNGLFRCRSENHKEESCSHHDFGDDAGKQRVLPWRIFTVTIRCESIEFEIEAGAPRSNRPNRQRSDNRADDLHDDIRQHFP